MPRLSLDDVASMASAGGSPRRLSLDDVSQMSAAPARLSLDDVATMTVPSPEEARATEASSLSMMGMIDPSVAQNAPPPDQELNRFYSDTSRLERVTAPLEAGARQVQQIVPVIGANVSGRFGSTFEDARKPADDVAPYTSGQPRGAFIDAMRRQTPEEAAGTRQRYTDALGQSVGDIVKRQQQIDALPQNPATTGMLNAKTWSEAGEQFWRDPIGVMQGVVLQSLPSTAPALVAGVAGGPVTGAAVMGGTSALFEYTNTILGELAKAGVDVRGPDDLRAAFSNPALMEWVRDKAAKRGAVIGAVDAATMGLASKTMAPKAITSPMAREAVNIPAQIAAQGAAGGGGEAVAQLATEGRITEPGQILAEVVGEAAHAPAEVGALTAHRGVRSLAEPSPYQSPQERQRIEPIPPRFPDPSVPADVRSTAPSVGPASDPVLEPGSDAPAPQSRSLTEAEIARPELGATRPPGVGQRVSLDEVSRMAGPPQPAEGERITIDQVERMAPRTADPQGVLPDTAEMTPGANYVGFVPDRAGVAAADAAAQPVKRGALLTKLFKDLSFALYEGRVRGKGTLGFFRKPIEEVRIKRSNDMETAIHEVAHGLDFRFPELRRQWSPGHAANAAIRQELSGVSYDKTKLYEGFAEFVRLWATQSDQARARAPQFTAWFENWLAASAPENVRRSLNEFKAGAHDWFAQDALTRARSKIGPEEAVNEAHASIWTKLRQSTLDDLEGIRRMEIDLEGALKPAGAYETARLTRGASEIVNGALTLGTLRVRPDGSHSFEGKSLADILKPVQARLADFEMYAVGRAAAELRGQGRERLFTASEIQAMLDLHTPEFAKAFAQYQDWNNAILDFAQAKGVLNPQVRAMFRRFDYLPFHRIDTSTGEGTNKGDKSPIRELTGGTQNIKEPLQNIIANASMLIKASLQNEARLKVARLAKEEGGAFFMAEIPTEERSVKVPKDQIEKVILEAIGASKKGQLDPDERAALDSIIQNMAPLVEVMIRNQAPTGRNVVAVLDQGKPRYYEVADPILFRSLESLNRQAAQGILRVVGAARRIGQAGVTLTPDFAVANFTRDQLMAGIMSRHGFLPFIDGARGMVSRLRRDQNYKDFIANGGGIASHVMDEADYRKQLDMFYSSKGIAPASVLNTPARLKNALLRISEAAEVATRLGEFRRANRRGNARHAAYEAREVSTDFAMRGDAKDVMVKGDAATLSFLYDSVMFLKASMNGLERAYRAVRYDPNKWKVIGLTAALAMASAGLHALNTGNPAYDDLEDWDRDTHWHFFIPNGKGGRLHFRLPKLWEIGAISSLAERTVEATQKGLNKETALSFINVLRKSVNLDPIPQAINPILEVAMNKDRFTGRPIEPQGLENMEHWARGTAGTSSTMRAIGEATRDLPRSLQLSPAQVQHLLHGYLSTWGTYLTDASDATFFNRTRADKRTDQLPVLRRFYREEPPTSTRHVTELYDAIKAAHEVRNTMRAMDRQHRPDLAAERENRPENLNYNQLTRAERNLQALNREMREAAYIPSLEGLQTMAQQRAQIPEFARFVDEAKAKGAWTSQGALRRLLFDSIAAERNSIAKRVNLDVKEQRRAVGQ